MSWPSFQNGVSVFITVPHGLWASHAVVGVRELMCVSRADAAVGMPTEGQQYTDEDREITKYKLNFPGEQKGVVVKKRGDPIVRNAGGKIVLGEKQA